MDEKENGPVPETVAHQPSKTSVAQEKQEQQESPPDTLSQISQLEDALDHEREKSDDLLRRLQYLQADFENYRKRVEKEVGEVKRFSNERLLSDLLTVKDELDLAFAKIRETKQSPVLLEGVGMIQKRVQNILSKEGVERIPGAGSKFNPEYHEAALRVVSDEGEGTVLEEVRAGYMLKGRVLRPSIVKVAGKNLVEENEQSETGEADSE
ncbi:MAG TPA: nucleotide exchange factor GrpE [Candidatus Dormibacteraeota bacterium]|nr:nucleotide exchange factor GrpE [Candidatus Dormibacteraeota bacterium]